VRRRLRAVAVRYAIAGGTAALALSAARSQRSLFSRRGSRISGTGRA
jgi:hypothetical protein